jgi:lipopolysaccharide export system permease protein
VQIINRALLRELTTTTLAVAFVFVALFMVVSLVKILAKAAAGSFPAKLIFTMLGLQTVEILSLVLPLAFYIGLLLTLGRWYRDNEMTVLAACGVGLTQLLRPVLLIAAGFAAVVTLLAFYLAPVATRLVAQIKQDDSSRYEVAAITPGVFNELRRSGRASEGGVYYVEDTGADGEMQKVFVATRHLGRQDVLVAKTGHEVTDAASSDRFLVLADGVRYDGTPGQSDYQVIVFKRYTIRIEPPTPVLRLTSLHAKPSQELLADPSAAARAEWHSRLSKPISLLLLTVFALVFSYTQPRHGRYLSLFVAIFAYFLYSNLLGVGDAMLKRGRVPPQLGLWWIHVLFLALGAYLFWRRATNRTLLPAVPMLLGRRAA